MFDAHAGGPDNQLPKEEAGHQPETSPLLYIWCKLQEVCLGTTALYRYNTDVSVWKWLHLLVIKLLQLWGRSNSRFPERLLRVGQNIWMHLEESEKTFNRGNWFSNMSSFYWKFHQSNHKLQKSPEVTFWPCPRRRNPTLNLFSFSRMLSTAEWV